MPDALSPYLVVPHPAAIATALAMALFWTRLGPSPEVRRLGFWLGTLASAIAYPAVRIWLQGEPTRAVTDILTDNVDPSRATEAGPFMAMVDALVSGFAIQLAAAALMWVTLLLTGYPRDPRGSVAAAIAPALGFGLYATTMQLTDAFTGVTVDLGLVWPVLHAFAWMAGYLGPSYLLAKGWLSGRLASYAILASFAFALVTYAAYVAAFGWHPAIVTVLLFAAALAVFTGGAGSVPARR